MSHLPIPQTIIKSNMRMRRYKMPTSFITYLPDASVAGPLSTQGNIAGHKYCAAWNIQNPFYIPDRP